MAAQTMMTAPVKINIPGLWQSSVEPAYESLGGLFFFFFDKSSPLGFNCEYKKIVDYSAISPNGNKNLLFGYYM